MSGKVNVLLFNYLRTRYVGELVVSEMYLQPLIMFREQAGRSENDSTAYVLTLLRPIS